MGPAGGPRRTRVERGIYRQPNGKYAVCWRHTGRLRFRTVGFDLARARRERLALIAATRRGQVPVSPRLRFETVVGWWLERFEAKVRAGERHPRTLEAHRYHLERHLLPVFAYRRIGSITVDDAAELLHALRCKGCSPKTSASALATLQSVMRFARRHGWIAGDPVEQLERDERPSAQRRRQRVLGRAEIERLLAACSPHDRLMIATVLYSGFASRRCSDSSGRTSTSPPACSTCARNYRAPIATRLRDACRRRPPRRSATSRSFPSSPICSTPTNRRAGSPKATTGCSRQAAAHPTATATCPAAASAAPPSAPGSTRMAGRRCASTTCATRSPAT